MYDDGEIRVSDLSKWGFRICSHPTPRQDTTATHSAKKAAWGPSGQDEHAHASDGKKALYSSSLAPRPPAETRDTSAYVIAAINRLGESGGVAPLANRLGVGRRAPFGEVLETFRIGKALRAHASARSMKEVHWVLKECAAVAMLSAPPESMRAATKTDIAECVSSVRDLALTGHRATQPPLELMQELEQLELAMAMKVGREEVAAEQKKNSTCYIEVIIQSLTVYTCVKLHSRSYFRGICIFHMVSQYLKYDVHRSASGDRDGTLLSIVVC